MLNISGLARRALTATSLVSNTTAAATASAVFGSSKRFVSTSSTSSSSAPNLLANSSSTSSKPVASPRRVISSFPPSVFSGPSTQWTPSRSFASENSAIKTAAEALYRYPKATVTELPNGLRIVSEPTRHETLTVGVWVDAGSRYEDESTNGVAHFMEHMLFKGTPKRSQLQFEQEIENMGGNLNAYTSRENMVFYANVFKKDLGQAMDIIGDIICNTEFSDAAIERERNTILTEKNEVESHTNEVVFDRLHETAFQGTPLSRSILGDEYNISNISKNDLVQFKARLFSAPRVVIVAVGDLDHGQLVELAKKHFAALPATSSHPVIKTPAIFTGSEFRARYDEMAHAHVALAYPVGGHADYDTTTLNVISNMLGAYDQNVRASGHSSSPFVSHLFEESIVTSASPFLTLYSEVGLFGSYLIGGQMRLDDALSLFMWELTRFSYEIDEDRLVEAKNNISSTLLATLDGTTNIAEEIGRQMLHLGRRMHPLEHLARVNAVDAAAVKKCARKYFYDRDHVMAAVGPIYDLGDYNIMRTRSYWPMY